MVLHFIRHGLIQGRGVPIGLLASAFQLNSLMYIFGAEFRGPAFSTTPGKHRRWPLLIIILVAILMAMLAGPSSAITMIPKLDWWALPQLYQDNRVTFSAFIQAPNATIFPGVLTADQLPERCLQQTAMTMSDCPSSGVLGIINNAPVFTGTTEGQTPTTNITMTTPNGRAQRFLNGRPTIINIGDNTLYAASTMPDFVAMAMTQYHDDVYSFSLGSENNEGPLRTSIRAKVEASLRIRGKMQQIYKPLVEVECEGSALGPPRITFPHDTMRLPPWTSDPVLSAEWSILSSRVSNIIVDDASDSVNFTWVALQDFEGPKPSLLALFATTPVQSKDSRTNHSLFACTIDARWIAAKPWIDLSVDNFIYDSEPRAFDDVLEATTGTGSVSEYPSLLIDLSWAASLNIPYVNHDITNQTRSSAQTVLQVMGSKCLLSSISSATNFSSTSTMSIPACLEAALALYVTDGLARSQSAIPAFFVSTGHKDIAAEASAIQPLYKNCQPPYECPITNITIADLQDSSKYTEIYLPISRYGYGYGFKGITVYIAIAVLLIHVLFVLIYTAFVCCKGISSGAWSSIGEMLVLAMNSSPTTKLQNTCAGVAEAETWGLVAKVRERNESHLELIVEEGGSKRKDGTGAKLEFNKQYGSISAESRM